VGGAGGKLELWWGSTMYHLDDLPFRWGRLVFPASQLFVSLRASGAQLLVVLVGQRVLVGLEYVAPGRPALQVGGLCSHSSFGGELLVVLLGQQ